MVKSYLGDGVYAESQSGGILLTSENGVSVLDSIFLEPEVLDALINFSKEGK
jgi:hypothetical protein